jgi:hypothetical protein
MENTTFSFDNMAQKIFTPDSTGVKFNKESKNLSLTTSIMKQSVLIADDDVKIDQADSYKDAIYRIKESEKIISKKILFDLYKFQMSLSMDHGDSYRKSYKYTNLSDPIPCLKKLSMVLTQIETMMNNYSGVGVVSDKAKSYYDALNEMIHHINDDRRTIIGDLTGCHEVTDADLVAKTYAHFRGGEKIQIIQLGSGDKIGSRLNEIKENVDKITDSVALYNSSLNDVIKRLNKIRSELAIHYRAMDDQQGRQIDFRKQELSNTICSYFNKYLKYANIIYSMKADAISEYLNPSESDSYICDQFKITESYDISDDEDALIDEDTDLSDLYTFSETKEVIYSDQLIALESEFTNTVVYDLINEADENSSKEIWDRVKGLFGKIKEAVLDYFGMAAKKLQNIKNDKSLLGNMQKVLDATANEYEVEVPSVNLDAALSRSVNLNMKDFQFFYEKIMSNENTSDEKTAIPKLLAAIIPEMNNLEGLDDNKTCQRYLKNYFAGNDLTKVKDIKDDNVTYVMSKLTAANMKTITAAKLFAQVDAIAELKVPAQFGNKLQNKLEAAQRYKDQELNKIKTTPAAANGTQESVNIKKILEEYFNDIDGVESYNEDPASNADGTQPQPNKVKAGTPPANGNNSTGDTPQPDQKVDDQQKPEDKKDAPNPEAEKKIKSLETAFNIYSKVVNNILSCEGDALKAIYNDYYNKILKPLIDRKKLDEVPEEKPEEGQTTETKPEEKKEETPEQNNEQQAK